MIEVVGKVVSVDLSKVSPNPWNPNEMDAHTRASLKHGFETTGWLSSQALLLWGKDENGVRQDLIIDGEQRWTVARELDMKKGPGVWLDGLTSAQAKALTIGLDQKRGSFNQDRLGELVAELLKGSDVLALSLDLGLRSQDIVNLTKPRDIPAPVRSENVHTKQVPLYFDADQHAEFDRLIGALAPRLKTETVTDTVLAALRLVSETKRVSRG
jgi:ParB-like chromosome segregation protein Spo0J